jgi:hypothetical protein
MPSARTALSKFAKDVDAFANKYNLEVQRLIGTIEHFAAVEGDFYGMTTDKLLQKLHMRREKFLSVADSSAHISKVDLDRWIGESQANLAITMELTGCRLKIEKIGNEQHPRMLVFLLIEPTPASIDSSPAEATRMCVIKFKAYRAYPYHLVNSAPGQQVGVLQPGTVFKCTRDEYVFKACLADNKQFPETSKVLIHSIDIDRAGLESVPRKEFITWMKDVRGTLRFRELDGAIEIAFSISTFHAASYWAYMKYPLSGDAGDYCKCWLQNPDTLPPTLRGLGDGKRMIYVELLDPGNGISEDFEWIHIRNCFERRSRWVSIGPGSRIFRVKNLNLSWKSGGEWRNHSLVEEAKIAPMTVMGRPVTRNNPMRAFSAAQPPPKSATRTVSATKIGLDDLPCEESKYCDDKQESAGSKAGESTSEEVRQGPAIQLDKSHNFQSLGPNTREQAEQRTLQGTGNYTTINLSRLMIRGQGGQMMEGGVELHINHGVADDWARKATVRSLCTVIAGRDADNVRVPAAPAGGEIALLLVVSKTQWQGATDIYLSALKGDDGGWRGIAVADDTLLPDMGGNVAHRRLLALRLAMLLRGAGTGGPLPHLRWTQWVQIDDNVLCVVDANYRPISFAKMLEEIGSFVSRFPAITVAEVDHRYQREMYVDELVQKTGSGKLTVVAWDMLDAIKQRYGEGSLDLLFPCAPRLEDYFFQLMLMQMPRPGSVVAPLAGIVAWRPRRYFGLVRSRADAHRAKVALVSEGWTNNSWSSPSVLRSGVDTESYPVQRHVVRCGEAVRGLIIKFVTQTEGRVPISAATKQGGSNRARKRQKHGEDGGLGPQSEQAEDKVYHPHADSRGAIDTSGSDSESTSADEDDNGETHDEADEENSDSDGEAISTDSDDDNGSPLAEDGSGQHGELYATAAHSQQQCIPNDTQLSDNDAEVDQPLQLEFHDFLDFLRAERSREQLRLEEIRREEESRATAREQERERERALVRARSMQRAEAKKEREQRQATEEREQAKKRICDLINLLTSAKDYKQTNEKNLTVEKMFLNLANGRHSPHFKIEIRRRVFENFVMGDLLQFLERCALGASSSLMYKTEEDLKRLGENAAPMISHMATIVGWVNPAFREDFDRELQLLKHLEIQRSILNKGLRKLARNMQARSNRELKVPSLEKAHRVLSGMRSILDARIESVSKSKDEAARVAAEAAAAAAAGAGAASVTAASAASVTAAAAAAAAAAGTVAGESSRRTPHMSHS